MGKINTCGTTLLVPVMTIGFSFHEKEEYSLNTFQTFLISSIERNASICQIVDATQLTENVIRSEINQLISQKLLAEYNGAIVLSDLSQHILKVSRVIKQLNNESKKVTINLITGELYPCVPAETNKQEYIPPQPVQEQPFRMTPLISNWEIDGLSIKDEESTAFFKSYMDSFADMSDDEISDILTSLYIEYDTKQDSKISYRPVQVNYLPCLLGGVKNQPESKKHQETEDTDPPATFGVQGYKMTFTYCLKSRFIEENREILNLLSPLYEKDRSLISEKGLHYMEKYEAHSNLLKKVFLCTFDTVSGEYTLNDGNKDNNICELPEYQNIHRAERMPNTRKKICLELPELYDPACFDHNDIKMKLARDYQLSEDVEVFLAGTSKEPYVMISSLTELQMPCMTGGLASTEGNKDDKI